MTVGIAGKRSWIAKALHLEFLRLGTPVELVEKADLGNRSLGHLDCLYLILGRAKPSQDEMSAEVEQVRALLTGSVRSHAKRIVYLSSKCQTEAKRMCESLLSQKIDCAVDICRPAAVFGPGQDINSDMLIPGLGRDEHLELTTPNTIADFIHIDDLLKHLVNFSNPTWSNVWREGEPNSPYNVLGTFQLKPYQVKALAATFREYITRQVRDDGE